MTKKVSNRSLENVAQFRYLGMTMINQNPIREEIKRGLNLGNTYYYLVEILLFSCVLSKNITDRIYKTIVLTVVLYGYKTWSVIKRGT
jgi:hypothetical protein